MLMPRFEYRMAREAREAAAWCAEIPGARFLAGGTDLLSMARAGAFQPSVLVDIKGIPGLGEIRVNKDGSVDIGAAVTVASVARHPRVRSAFGVLATCCESLGSYPIRERATVVGNLCTASPCADTAAALLTLEATLHVVTPGDETREIPLVTFFRGPRQTALGPGELVTHVRIPDSTAGVRGVYLRLARRRGVDIATVAALVAELADPSVERFRYRVSLLSVAPTPLRVLEAERILDAAGPGEAAALRAAEASQAACRPITDVRGTAEYRRDMVGVLVARAVRELGKGGGGETAHRRA